MSATGNFIIAETRSDIVEGELLYLTNYRYKFAAPNGNADGLVTTAVVGLTESTFNLSVQQKVADRANLESAESEGFTVSDVYGGRI